MTKGTKWLIPQSLTTPGLTTHATHRAGPGVAHPSNGGELSPRRERNKSPVTTDGVLPPYHRGASSSSSGGVPRENAIFVGGWGGVV